MEVSEIPISLSLFFRFQSLTRICQITDPAQEKIEAKTRELEDRIREFNIHRSVRKRKTDEGRVKQVPSKLNSKLIVPLKLPLLNNNNIISLIS